MANGIISTTTWNMLGKQVQVSRTEDDPSIHGVLEEVDDFGILLSEAVVDWSGMLCGQVVRYSDPVMVPWKRIEMIRLSRTDVSLRIA